jgi:hypothetical protein
MTERYLGAEDGPIAFARVYFKRPIRVRSLPGQLADGSFHNAGILPGENRVVDVLGELTVAETKNSAAGRID